MQVVHKHVQHIYSLCKYLLGHGFICVHPRRFTYSAFSACLLTVYMRAGNTTLIWAADDTYSDGLGYGGYPQTDGHNGHHTQRLH